MNEKTAIDYYVKDISKKQLLTREQTIELFKQYEQGDKNAYETLIESNLRLVVSIAKSFARPGADLEDLVAEGNIGLMKAITRFDWKRGFALSTYATWWIKQAIMKHLTNKSRTIRLPAHVIGIKGKRQRIIDEYRDEFGEDPTDDELLELLGVSEKMFKATEGAKIVVPLSSLDGDGTQTRPLEEKIVDDEMLTPFEMMSNAELSKSVRGILKTLTPKEEAIIRLRFGIVDNDCEAWPITSEQFAMVSGGTGMRDD